jgi:hypothetical protein
MTAAVRRALAVLAAALALGALADALLRVTPWGLNAAVWGVSLLAVVAALTETQRFARYGVVRQVLPAAVCLALAFAWRDSPALKALDALGLAVLLALMTLYAPAVDLRRSAVSDYLEALRTATASALTRAAPMLAREIPWSRFGQSGPRQQALAAGRGVLLAAPLLVLFGGLFASADAVFRQYALWLVSVDLGTLPGHVLVTAASAWLVAGFLRGLLVGAAPIRRDDARLPFTLGFVEAAVTLALLDLLFLLFVIVQVRYLFGGAAVVQASAGLTYAEYARRGFFELAAVAALVLPLLLAADALLRTDHSWQRGAFRALAGAQLVLLFVIMASAIQRMRLYQQEFGLTELRVYVTAFMLWLAAVSVWFAATVLRGRRERFVFGALVAALAVVGLLHAVNPDALIARVNTDRAAEGRRFDARYVASLSADAVPELVQSLPALPPADRCTVARALLARHGQDAMDWRTWSWSRSRAVRVMDENQARLAGMPCG